MERLATLFTGSFRQLKQVKTVTVCAMLGAVAIVLGSLSIELGSTLRIGFSGIPNEIVHMLDENMDLDIEAIESFCERHHGERIFLFGFTFMIWEHFFQALRSLPCLQA